MWNIVVEGYKPQDFSFFHRSEKFVQRQHQLWDARTVGNQVGIIIRNVKNELFHYANRLILNEVKGIECLLLAAKLLNQIQIKKS